MENQNTFSNRYQLNENNTDRDYEILFDSLFKSMSSKSLFVVVGAGVSISQLYPDWDQYVDSLINFWRFNLDIIKKNENIPNLKEPDSHDISFLKMLSDSKLSNKRKVDLVHHIIRKYCQTESHSVSNQLFRKYALSFERKFFLEYKPMILTNPILHSLIKLNPIFITTNYDQEIEKTIESIYPNSTRILHDSSQISKELAVPESIMHIHGTPTESVNFDLFINSSKSYSDLYYCNPIFRDKFREIFKERANSVVLFVGCSMEEDEVLSLFDFEESNIEYFSLMKYITNHSNESLSAQFNNTIKDYYDSKRIKFVWYGMEYVDLEKFVNKVVIEIFKLEKLRKTPLENLRDTLLGKGI